MRIGVDLDNTLANLAYAAMRVWNDEHPEDHIHQSDFFSWNANEALGLSRAQFFNLLKLAWYRWKKYMHLMEKHANKSLDMLRSHGHSIHIITNRDVASHSYVIAFLEQEGITYDAFSIINHGIPKLSFPIDVLLDDHPKMGEAAKRYPDKKVLLYDQPWNRHIEETANLTRVPSMRHVVAKIFGSEV